LKTQLVAASGPIFDYLLGETDRLDLAQTLRNTLLSTDFVKTLLDSLDVSSLMSELLEDELTEFIPEDVDITIDELGDVIAILEPSIKQATIEAADPILDYLLGETHSLSVPISLEPIRDDLKTALRQAFLDNLPSGWEQLPQYERDRRLDEFITEAMDVIPSTFELDETMFGSEISEDVAEGLAEAQDALGDAREDIQEALSEAESDLEEPRTPVGYFITGYWALIAFMGVLVLAIIGIHHQVKGATLQLGITFLICGAIQYITLFIGKNIASGRLTDSDIWVPVQELLQQLLRDVASPVGMLSIGLMAGGAVLIAVSIIYPRLRPSEAD